MVRRAVPASVGLARQRAGCRSRKSSGASWRPATSPSGRQPTRNGAAQTPLVCVVFRTSKASGKFLIVAVCGYASPEGDHWSQGVPISSTDTLRSPGRRHYRAAIAAGSRKRNSSTFGCAALPRQSRPFADARRNERRRADWRLGFQKHEGEAIWPVRPLPHRLSGAFGKHTKRAATTSGSVFLPAWRELWIPPKLR